MKSASVKIGPSFFSKEFHEYTDWRWAYIREAAQNGQDAPKSNKLYFNISKINDPHTDTGSCVRVVFGNNGSPMDEETLVNKLLAIGESGKNFQGSVGGFGKAKLILMYAHQGWKVRTGTLLVEGIGGDYELHDNLDYFHGTETTVTMKDSYGLADDLTRKAKVFATLSQWPGEITVNGDPIAGRTQKGARRKELDWGVIYTNKSAEGLLLVRINGVPMFTKSIQHKGMVLIELKGTSGDVLTANRDGLRWSQQAELDDFMVSISTNARKAFKDDRKTSTTTYEGYKLAGIVTGPTTNSAKALATALAEGKKLVPVVPGRFEQTNTDTDITGTDVSVTQDVELVCRIAEATQPGRKSQGQDAPALSVDQVLRVFRPEFNIRSEIGGKLPAWFLPGTFSDNSKRLVSNWISVLVELASMTGSSKTFSVGFVFDPDVEGLHEREGSRDVLYVSPAVIVEKEGKPRQLKVRWSFNAAGNWRLLSLAVHEWAHLEGFSAHDEAYANRLTDLFALVLANRTRFSRHFSSPCCWPE